MTANTRRLMASGNEVISEEQLLHHPASFSATASASLQTNRLSQLQRSLKHLSFMARGQEVKKDAAAMVDPMAMCALAQKLLRREKALPVLLSVAPLPDTEVQNQLRENSWDSKNPHSTLLIPLPGVPSRCFHLLCLCVNLRKTNNRGLYNRYNLLHRESPNTVGFVRESPKILGTCMFFARTCMSSVCVQTCARAYMHVRIHINPTLLCVCLLRVCMLTHVHTYMHVYAYIHIYIHTHVHTYTCTYIHAYIHTHVPLDMRTSPQP